MKIKTRLRFNTLFSVIILLLAGLMILANSHRLGKAIQKNNAIHQITRAVFELNILSNEFVFDLSVRAKRQWHLRYDSLSKLIGSFELKSGEESLLIAEIIQNQKLLKSVFFNLTKEYTEMEDHGEKLYRGSELRNRLADKLITKSQTMVSVSEQLAESAGQKAISVQQNASLFILMLIVAPMLLIFINSIFMGKSFVKPILNLQKGTQIIGEGNLDYTLDSSAQDEIGELSKAFDLMTEKLKVTTVSRDKLENEITERIRAEEDLIKSETFLNAAGQIAKVGGWEIDGETQKVFWTKEIYNITEVPPDYDPSSLEEEAIVFFNEKDQLILEKAIQRAFEHAEPYNMEFLIKTAKGNRKWVQAICKPIVVDGKVVRLSGTFQDINERKQAEKALRESEENFREMAENIKEVFWLRTHDEMIYISPAYEDVWGRTCESLIQNPSSFVEAVHPEDRERIFAAFSKEMTDTTNFNEEYRIVRSDGSVRWIWARSFQIKSHDGQDRSAGIGEDITNRKLSEEQIKSSLKEKEVLLREIYHRSKNNMQVIISMLSLQARSIEDKNVLTIFGEMENRIRSMALVHEKLYQTKDLSRIDLKEYFNDLMSLLVSSYKELSGGITINTDMDSIPVTIDYAIPCGLIINEIISNCFKHAFSDRSFRDNRS